MRRALLRGNRGASGTARGETAPVQNGSSSALVSGRYELGDLLGRGGMGEVRAARDLTLNRDVAVKLLHESLAGDERVSRRFQHEAHAAARLTHPNVVRVYDAGEHDGRPFIVMELLPGETLADEIARGPLPELRVRAIAVQVLDALAEAHRHGVLHRDVKPSNVLLAPGGAVRVGDFGIAKTDLATDATTTGTVVGTLGYLAPERLHGEPATAASDVYSVGVLLYEALTGQRPFSGDNPVALLTSVQRGSPPPIRELRPDVDPWFAALVHRAMSVAPAARVASAELFAAELRSATHHPPSSPDSTAVMPTVTEAMPVAPRHIPPPPPPFQPPPEPVRPPPPEPYRAPAVPEPYRAPARRRARVLRAVLIVLVLGALGFGVGLGLGTLLDDDPATSDTDGAGTTDDPVERALRVLEEAVTP
jgi:serine/threonine protein kinase